METSKSSDYTLPVYAWKDGEPKQLVYSLTADDVRASDGWNKKICEILESGFDFAMIDFLDGFLFYGTFMDPIRGRQYSGGVESMEELMAYMEKDRQACSLQVFTPRELYALAPIPHHSPLDSYDLQALVRLYLPEVQEYDTDFDAVLAQNAIDIRYLANVCFDGRRTWTLATVWYKHSPVMVITSSGRDGDEYHERYVTDSVVFHQLLYCFWIHQTGPAVIDANVPLAELTEFYNATLHDFYDVESQTKKELKR